MYRQCLSSGENSVCYGLKFCIFVEVDDLLLSGRKQEPDETCFLATMQTLIPLLPYLLLRVFPPRGPKAVASLFVNMRATIPEARSVKAGKV